jgi:hypothetical protein
LPADVVYFCTNSFVRVACVFAVACAWWFLLPKSRTFVSLRNEDFILYVLCLEVSLTLTKI